MKTDSQLIAGQVRGDFEVKEPRLHRYFSKVMGEKARFGNFNIEPIPREMNQRADGLAKNASIRGTTESIEVLLESGNMGDPPQTPGNHVFATSATDEGWMRPITQYLTLGNLPTDPREARSVRLKAARYSMVGEQLYRRSTMGPMLRCIGPVEAQKLMEEIHEGVCGNHFGGRSLAHKALTAG
ncbi:hypothetical protein PanWU01x14_276310 [Parasponia andersonii]|uniref:RNase H type-1 domain-containing protein n=1 Tax=Parasponia andersonii TaxID=3476 RepID=A0A2P5B2X7_PARAD|nr:hypothetical protein PanWU01x14_276310 [Parasponia andersonii]